MAMHRITEDLGTIDAESLSPPLNFGRVLV